MITTPLPPPRRPSPAKDTRSTNISCISTSTMASTPCRLSTSSISKQGTCALSFVRACPWACLPTRQPEHPPPTTARHPLGSRATGRASLGPHAHRCPHLMASTDLVWHGDEVAAMGRTKRTRPNGGQHGGAVMHQSHLSRGGVRLAGRRNMGGERWALRQVGAQFCLSHPKSLSGLR